MFPLYDANPTKRTPVITLLLIAANLGVFGYQVWLLATGGSGAMESWLGQHAMVPKRFFGHLGDSAQWQTLLTHQFLHGGVAHVLGNCWFLWLFGNNVEDRMGSFRFPLFYLLSGVAAAGLQLAFGMDSTLPMVGASGAISGVLGAYLLLFPKAWVITLVPWPIPIVPVPAVVFLVLWFVIQAFNGVGNLLSHHNGPGVAWWAHAGGFVGGMMLLGVLGTMRSSGKRRS